ncbi:MAG: tetratricopeptide repeat protein [Comamonas sp.]
MATDYLGNPLAPETARQPGLVQAINDFVEGLLTYHPKAAHILEAAQAAPGDTLVNAYAGFLTMFMESSAAPALARRHLDAARRTAAQAPPRVQRHVDLLQAWIADDIPAALRSAEQLLDAFPRDLFAAKLAQYLHFNRGDHAAMLRIGLKACRQAPDVAQTHGMLAFAYEQCHLLAEAEQTARQALALDPREPWAQHALAHVLLTQGRILEGIGFMESVRHHWDGLNSFIYTHNWWHLALFYIARGRTDRALQIYDRHVWGIVPEYAQDQIGAVSLLVRLELAQADVGDRWQPLADYLTARADDVTQPFLSLQYLYGLARAQRPQADQLLQALQRQAREAPAHSLPVWRDITLPAAHGLLAHARGRPADAARLLGSVLPQLDAIGGSHAQRDLFTQIQQDAALQAGHWRAAQQFLELRRLSDPDDAIALHALVRVYTQLGIPEQAARTQQRLAQAIAQGQALP